MWIALSLLCTFCLAVTAEANRVFQCDGLALNAVRSLIAFVFLLLLWPLTQWPDPLPFYAVATLDGALSIIAMIIFLNLSARSSGRVSSMYIPVSAVTGFVLWSILAPDSLDRFTGDPVRASFAALGFLIVTAAVQMIRRNDTGWQNFIAVLPVGLIFGTLSALMKYVIDPAWPALAVSVAYCLIAFGVSAALCWLLVTRRMPVKALLADRALIKAGAITGLSSAVFLVSLTVALVDAPNPSYPCVVTMTVPLWLLLYHKVRGLPDNASPYAGLALLTGAVVMMLAVEGFQ